jgi:hypothetical protein
MTAVEMITQTLDMVVFILKWFWWLIIVGILFGMKMAYKKYPVDVVIVEKRGKNLIRSNDRAGKYVDPYTGMIGYKLQKSGDTIPVVDFDWVMHNNFQPTNVFERIVNFLRGNAGAIFLYKYGSRQYKPVKISQDGKTVVKWEEVKDAKGNPILVSIIRPIDPREKMAGLDFEVVDWDNMNFMTQEQRASIERRKKKSEMWKQILIPALMIGAAVIICIVMIKYGYDAMNSLLGKGSPQPTTDVPKENPNPNIPIIGDMLPK